jgi:hypothetical protein
MINRLDHEDGSVGGPCPLCDITRSENLDLNMQLEICHGIIAQQLDLLRDLTYAADAADAYLADLGFPDADADEDNTLN